MNRTARSVYHVVSWFCSTSLTRGFGHPRTVEQRQIAEPIAGRGVQRPHVVGIWQAEVLVEAVIGGQELGMVAQVPLAEAGRGVALRLDHLRQGCLAGADPVPRRVRERAEDPDPHVVAAGQQGRPRGGADGLGDVEVGELPAFLGQPVQVRRRIALGAERTDVGVAHVVDVDDDEVGRPLGGGERSREQAREECESQGRDGAAMFMVGLLYCGQRTAKASGTDSFENGRQRS